MDGPASSPIVKIPFFPELPNADYFFFPNPARNEPLTCSI